MNFTLKKIAEEISAELQGDPEKVIAGVNSIEDCSNEEITYAEGETWIKKVVSRNVGAVIVTEQLKESILNQLIHPTPQLAMIKVTQLFYPESKEFSGISKLAEVSESASITAPVSVESFTVIKDMATVGSGTRISHGVFIGKNAVIGDNCTLHPNVVVHDNCVLGNNVIVHSGTVIGSDGFGFVQHEGKNIKIPQVGRVVIGNDVEIGSNCCFDRGAFGDTIIGNGVKFDNLVQVGHNVVIGDNCIVVAQVGISGSSTLGENVILAGKVGLKEHVNIGDRAVVLAQSVVTHDLEADGVYAGYPAMEAGAWRKCKVIQRTLPKSWPKIQKLIKEKDKK